MDFTFPFSFSRHGGRTYPLPSTVFARHFSSIILFSFFSRQFVFLCPNRQRERNLKLAHVLFYPSYFYLIFLSLYSYFFYHYSNNVCKKYYFFIFTVRWTVSQEFRPPALKNELILDNHAKSKFAFASRINSN